MKKMMTMAVAMLCTLAACQKSIEDRAAEEARNYTEKYCPTPVYNYTRTDSLTFERTSRTFVYYCSLTGDLDSPEFISAHGAELRESLLGSIRESTQLKLYKDAGFSFRYVIHSAKSPKTTLFKATFEPKEYQ